MPFHLHSDYLLQSVGPSFFVVAAETRVIWLARSFSKMSASICRHGRSLFCCRGDDSKWSTTTPSGRRFGAGGHLLLACVIICAGAVPLKGWLMSRITIRLLIMREGKSCMTNLHRSGNDDRAI